MTYLFFICFTFHIICYLIIIIIIIIKTKHYANQYNYNRATGNDVCVWQSIPRTADVTVTKIAGYVRVRILINRWYFPYFWHS